MKRLTAAGLAGLTSLGALAQSLPLTLARTLEPAAHTATRSVATPVPTLRDVVVISRDELESLGALTLAEVLQLRVGVEIGSAGGAGQPQGVFLRGASPAQVLVLVDGLRIASPTSGHSALEALPLEMIERIEVVKGAMSGLYGTDAMGGVVQVFTRGKAVPHLFAAGAYGSDNDRRLSAGLATADLKTSASLSLGARRVEARSAANLGSPAYDPDREPHDNGFIALRVSQVMWQGEKITLEGFASRSRTHLDGDAADRRDHLLAGGRLTSSATFRPGWASELALGHTREVSRLRGLPASRFETRQHQASWIQDVKTPTGNAIAGAEFLRQELFYDALGARNYAVESRDTVSVFAGVNERIGLQRLEASFRRDDDDEYGVRNTGTVSVGTPLMRNGPWLVGTFGRAFRAPGFDELYLAEPGRTPNPLLRPERSRSYEVAARGGAWGPVQQWKVTAFDHRLEDVIVFSPAAGTALNVERGRIRGVEASVEASWWGTKLRASYTAQNPRDEVTDVRLQGRARRFGAFEASRGWGAFTAGVSVITSGERFDSRNAAADSRMAAYTRVDARLRYDITRLVKAELSAVNLTDKRYETARGFDAPRRGVLLTLRLDAF